MLPPLALVSGLTRVSQAFIVNHDTGVETEVGLVSADVTVDRRSECRRTVSAVIADADPALLSAPHRLRIVSGYRAFGRDWLAPVAHVRIGKRSRAPLGAWQVSGQSFESLVRAARFPEPRRVEGSSLVAIQALLLEAVPWATVIVTASRDETVPGGGVVFDEERLEAIVGREGSLATALGVDVYCDGDGAFVIADPPSLDTAAWDTAGMVVDWTETLDPSTVVNSWRVSTDHQDVYPTRAVVDDDDPVSPTRVARWGVSRKGFASPLLADAVACARAARTLLDSSRGVQVDLDLTTPPNPWADVTEPVVAVADSGTARLMLDRLTHRISNTLDEPLSLTAQARLVSLA